MTKAEQLGIPVVTGVDEFKALLETGDIPSTT
jgi:hypothetical protein